MGNLKTTAFTKKRSVALLLLLLLVMPFCLAATQVSQSFADDNLNIVAYVVQEDGSGMKEYYNYDEAWAAAKKSPAKEDGATLYMVKDWTTSTALVVESGVKVQINMAGHMINRNNVNASKPDYASDSSNDGSVFILRENAKLTITGGTTSIEHKGDLLSSGKFWHYNKSGKTTICGALITGGATDSKMGGGGIVLEEKAKLIMSDVTVAGNIADRWGLSYGYGGAISLYDENASAELTNCNLKYNYAQSGGGAVSVYDHSCSFKMLNGGSVSSNHTDNYGGGIYIDNTGLKDKGEGQATVSLSTAEISNNSAGEDGGGVYLGGLGVQLTGGKITGNAAQKSGGGVYVKRDDCGLKDCTVTNNEAGTRGGGVLIENDNDYTDFVPALYLSGTIVVKDNKVNNAKSNMLLRNSNAFYYDAKIYGIPSSTSEIWISAEEDGVISYNADSYNDAIYYADNDNKVVYWETNSSDENYRYLKLGNKSDGHSKSGYVSNKVELKASETSRGTGNLQATSYDYNGYSVYKGYSMEDRTYLLNAYYYSDGYFMESSENYNEHLASFAFHLTCSAMNSSVFNDSRGNKREYMLAASHAKQLLADIGVEEENIFLSPTYFTKPTTDSIACAIGSKTLKNSDGSDSDVTLVTIGVRGQGYDSEWASNVTLGGLTLDGADEGAEHEGFSESANIILNSWVEPYLEQRGLDEKAKQGKVRFLVTGFSRGAAVANILSKKLVDNYEFEWMVGDNHVVFGYTFEAPQGGNYSKTFEDRSYIGIHNIILSGDLVPYVAMSTMNFQRYGVDHYLGGTAAGTASKDVITGDGAESEGQAKRYSRRYAGWLSHTIKLSNDKFVVNTEDWKSTHFMKDNDYYEVGSAEYEKCKDAMLKQLAACDNSVTFDDYFHLAQLSMQSHGSAGNTEEVGSDSVKLAQFLDDFMFYLNLWLINTDNLQVHTSRYHYITNLNFGTSEASYQETARALMAALYSGGLKTDKLKDRLLSSDTLSDVAAWIFGFTSDSTATELIRILTKHGVFSEDSISLTEGQAIALTRMLTNVIEGDWSDVEDYVAGTGVDYDADDDGFVMSGTLLYNISRIMLNHKPDVVCAWLRSEDSYYTSDDEVSTTQYSVASATSSEVNKPYLTMKVNGEEVTVKAGEACNLFDYDMYNQPTVTDIQLHTEDCNAGGMVFYVEGDGSSSSSSSSGSSTEAYSSEATSNSSEESKYKNYSYYDINSSKLLDGVTDWSETQKITAHTVWYNTPSDDATFTIYYQQSSDVKSVFVNGELFGKYKRGDTVTVPITPEDEYHEFASCTLVKTSMAPDTDWWDLTEDRSALVFTMPGGDTYWEIGYRQKTVAGPSATPDNGRYDDVQYIEFSTSSGTEEEGFVLSYTYYGTTESWPTEAVETSGDGVGGIVVYALDGRRTTWTINVTASHEGWISSSRQYIVNVFPTEKTYTVEVLNGTLVEDGQPTDKTTAEFKAGDTVTVAAADDGKVFLGWECDPADIISSDCKDKTVTFTMPSKDVALVALSEEAVTETPTASLEAGSYVGTQTVELSCATEGATIHYTLDGTEPDENSPAYDGAIEIPRTATLKAKAYCANMKASDVAEFAYTISHTVTFDVGKGSKVDSQTIVDGKSVVKPADPTLEGFKFDGWTLEDGAAYDFATPVTADLTLYATWSASDEPTPTPAPDDPDEPDEPSGATDDSSASEEATSSDSQLPASGDDVTAPVALLIAGCVCVAAAVILRRRRA